MSDGIIQVDFTPQEPPRRKRGWAWTIVGVVVFIGLLLLALSLVHALLPLLGIAAVLATISTWRLSRRRAAQRELFQRPIPGVSVRTYVFYLAAWFFGIIALVPLLLFGFVAAMIVLAIVAVVAIVLLVMALFNAG
jgi:hypothetical protein